MNDANLKIITEGTIRFSSPLEFNDPFDCLPAIDMESIEQMFQRRPELLKRAGDFRGLSPAKRLLHKGKFIANARKAVLSGDWARSVNSSVGLFCLSCDPCHPLMWAHYAKNHTGFTVEFSIGMDAPEEDLMVMIPYPVHYVEDRPVIDWAAKTVDLDKTLLTKSKHWEYEQEERALNPQQGPGIYKYSRKLFLKAVIAGAKMSSDDLTKLREAVARAGSEIGKPIAFYQAQLSDTRYRVFIPGHPDPAINADD
jgi:hypothetical protein